MQIRQGIDIASVKRLQAAMERHGKRFEERVFSKVERAYCATKKMKYEHFAARFAAKEAFIKALEVKRANGYELCDIEVRRQASGKPYIYLSPQSRKCFNLPSKSQIEISLAHERDFAIATVVILRP
jgi:holo-[acyl-carrier protein] synthase